MVEFYDDEGKIMHIGCCENCRYVDLIENVAGECPRCGTSLTPLGIESDDWNRMTTSAKEAIIAKTFPEEELLADPWNVGEPEVKRNKKPEEGSVEAVADFVEQLFAESSKKREEEATEALPEEDESEAEANPETEDSDDGEEQSEEVVVSEAEPEEHDHIEQQSQLQDEENNEYVYVCYKCSSIAGHEDSDGKYYCTECGSDMVPIGISTQDWMWRYTKEEKRKIAESAKIRHMVAQIKNASIDDKEAERTQNIIDVV